VRRQLAVSAALLLLCGTIAPAQGSLSAPRFPQPRVLAPESAVVDDRQVRFEIARHSPFDPVPDERSRVGYYAWRISVDAPERFTMVLMADTAMRASTLKDILRASTLRMCPSAVPASMLDCTVPIKARTELDADHFRLIIDDTEFVSRVRRERPLYYTRGRIEPLGRVQLVQRAWLYRDSRPR
jgi:hypothetical protein